MANPERTPGKYGRKPPVPGTYTPRAEHYLLPWEGPLANPLAAHHYMQATPSPYLPPATGVIDRAAKVTDWGMYLNDQLGDCTVAECCHAFEGMCAYAGNPVPVFSTEAVTAAYSACGGYVIGDPSTDNGCVVTDVLAYMRSTGIPDTTGKVHKFVAYASIDPRNRQLSAQVLATFGTAYFGGLVQNAQEAQFASGAPWQWQAGSPIAGGHAYGYAYRGVGYTGVHGVTTWGELHKSTGNFLWHSLDPSQGGEAFIVVSEDWVSANGTTVQGLDLQQLIADMSEVSVTPAERR